MISCGRVMLWLSTHLKSLPKLGDFADRLGVSSAALVFGVMCVIAAAASGWWALRSPPALMTEDVLPVVSMVSIPVPTLQPVQPVAQPMVKVHVAGAVKYPGVHDLRIGDRVTDAIEAAGGFTASADMNRLNLADIVSDGSRLWIPVVGETGEPQIVSATPSRSASANNSISATGGITKININTASADALESLPGIGKSLASAIIEHRERSGKFANVDELTEVSGIGQAKLSKIRAMVRV